MSRFGAVHFFFVMIPPSHAALKRLQDWSQAVFVMFPALLIKIKTTEVNSISPRTVKIPPRNFQVETGRECSFQKAVFVLLVSPKRIQTTRHSGNKSATYAKEWKIRKRNFPVCPGREATGLKHTHAAKTMRTLHFFLYPPVEMLRR